MPDGRTQVHEPTEPCGIRDLGAAVFRAWIVLPFSRPSIYRVGCRYAWNAR